MRRIGYFFLHVCASLCFASVTLSAAELKDLRECGCAQATCDSCVDVSCSAPGCTTAACDVPTCGVATCDTPTCDAISAACDTAPCACCNCFQCCDRFSVLAGAMFLRRADSGSVPLIINQNTGATIVDANNLEFNHQGMPRVQIMYENCCCWGWDLVYFGTDGWSTSKPGGGDESPVLIGPGVEFGNTAPGGMFQIDYSTELQNFEFNLRRRCHECWTWVAGFRWIELSDELTAYSTAPSLIEFYSVDADNHLYGFQIGADAVLLQPTSRFHVDSIFRVGIMGNSADQSTQAPYLSNFNGFVDNVTANDDGVSFMAELGIRGVIDLTNGWSIYGGYQALWLDGLALAPEQIPVTDMTAPGIAGLDNDGELLFHGATVGIQLTF